MDRYTDKKITSIAIQLEKLGINDVNHVLGTLIKK